MPLAVPPGGSSREGQTVAGPSDEELFQRVCRGEAECFSELVARYEKPLFALLFRLTHGDTHLADDLFQETFLRAARARRTFDPAKRFRPWLVAIAVNLARDEGRRRKVQAEVPLPGAGGPQDLAGLADGQQGPDGNAVGRDEAERLARSLRSLSDGEREVVVLHFYEHMTLVEVAEALAIPVGTVKSRLHAALTHLRDQLGA